MRGNHDSNVGNIPAVGAYGAGAKTAWDDVFYGRYALPANGPPGEENVTFSFTYDNILVIGLDQSALHDRVNQTWLDGQLKSHNQPHVFVFAHQAAFKILYWCMDKYPDDRDTFWNSLAANRARVYFAGHDHVYNHARVGDGDGHPDNDVHQIVVGTGGGPRQPWWNGSYEGVNGPWTPTLVYTERQYGYVLVEVSGLDVTMTWKHRTGPGTFEPGGDILTYRAERVRTFLPVVSK